LDWGRPLVRCFILGIGTSIGRLARLEPEHYRNAINLERAVSDVRESGQASQASADLDGHHSAVVF
jgi:hypothetical protein